MFHVAFSRAGDITILSCVRRGDPCGDATSDHRDARTIGGQKLTPDQLVVLGLAIVGVAGLLGFSLGLGAADEEDGILDDLGDLIAEGTAGVQATGRTLGALTGLVLAGGAIFLATRFLKE